MRLRPCPDPAPAAWLTTSEVPWDRLVTFGPAGLAAYARLLLLPDPDRPDRSENDVVVAEDHPRDDVRLRAALRVLGRHTATLGDCYFAVWDGWGLEPFAPSVLRGPRVVVPNREYFLFRGPLDATWDWGAAGPGAGEPRSDPPGPAFVWPADHAWCVAHDVDPHWIGVGATAAAVDELVAEPALDVVRADPREDQPRYV